MARRTPTTEATVWPARVAFVAAATTGRHGRFSRGQVLDLDDPRRPLVAQLVDVPLPPHANADGTVAYAPGDTWLADGTHVRAGDTRAPGDPTVTANPHAFQLITIPAPATLPTVPQEIRS